MKSESTVYRDYLIKCRANLGGKHLVPTSIQEIKLTPDDPNGEYDFIGEASKYFGDIREPLEKRGDLVKLKDGSDRITRTPHLGKTIRQGRNGFMFVQVRVRVPEWLTFTKRTSNPKLGWVMDKCKSAGLRVFKEGKSFHGPTSYVHRDDYAAAWAILGPIDNIPDDAPQFRSLP